MVVGKWRVYRFDASLWLAIVVADVVVLKARPNWNIVAAMAPVCDMNKLADSTCAILEVDGSSFEFVGTGIRDDFVSGSALSYCGRD